VNAGDDFGRRLARECRPEYGDDLWTYAIGAQVGSGATAPEAGFGSSPSPDALAVDLELRADGSAFTLVVPRLGLERRLELRLAARFNVENALAAAVTALALGQPLDAIVASLGSTEGVPGRYQAVRAGQSFSVIVDYSHTPDSLENALRAARAVTSGRVIAVFGCGGDRDRGKRPLMGEIGARLADLAVVTSDNPRSEEPAVIIDEIVAGVPATRRDAVTVEADRRAAIAIALRAADEGDTVVIAGKGHEQGQLIKGTRIPFDDRAVAEEVLAELHGAR
jgi:UDP-N-acetylmuramoyl-L-alanyl-D-glutamate--2,6-diaminopimelate ligase